VGFASGGWLVGLTSWVGVFVVAGGVSESEARLRFTSLGDLKSVSYQPLPFSRKLVAEINFFTCSALLQFGQIAVADSDIF
jgi:hypothetical protein